MNLDKFVRKLTVEFTEERLIERRMGAARVISERYNIHPPTVVMLFTLPSYRNKTIAERCESSGISEEELFLCMSQPGFKRFIGDYKAMLKDNLDLQSLDKLSDRITQPRINPTQWGEREELDIEAKVLEKDNVVNVTQNTQNNFYEQARMRALELEKD